MDIKVKCKRCSKEVRPEELTLDYTYKMMVCPNCVKERRNHEQVHKELKDQNIVKEPSKPAGWDSEDDYLERAHQEKLRNTVKVEKVSEDKVKYKCVHCKYEFLINIHTKVPKACPYCDTPVYRISL